MYYSCHCIKRNGLQHDCRRTGCGGEPACLVLPDPLCAPSQLARARGLADPAALAAHTQAQGGGGSGGPADTSSGGKKFIVCELKGIIPDVAVDKSGKCCKCPTTLVPTQASGSGGVKPQMFVVPTQASVNSSGAKPHTCPCTGVSVPVRQNPPANNPNEFCPCSCNSSGSNAQNTHPAIAFDEKTINQILKLFESKELASSEKKVTGHSGRSHNATKPVAKEEPCTRPGCIHWQPPPPCVWDLPCKADCFETPPSVQPGRNPLSGGGGFNSARGASGRNNVSQGMQKPHEIMKLLTPECCTGCSAPREGGAMASGGPAPGLPMLVMKLC